MSSHYPHEGGITELPEICDHVQPGSANNVESGVRLDRASTEARAMALVPEEGKPDEPSTPASTSPTGSTTYPHEGGISIIDDE